MRIHSFFLNRSFLIFRIDLFLFIEALLMLLLSILFCLFSFKELAIKRSSIVADIVYIFISDRFLVAQ